MSMAVEIGGDEAADVPAVVVAEVGAVGAAGSGGAEDIKPEL
jgi:hypothetical protein